jgi:hypothetical protein
LHRSAFALLLLVEIFSIHKSGCTYLYLSTSTELSHIFSSIDKPKIM